MRVLMMSRTKNAIKTAFMAIRTCYSPSTPSEIWNAEFDKYKEKNNDHIRLIKQIVNHGHTSTLEHISFTFAIEGISRSLLAQLTRHRIGFSYSVQSQRYVNLKSDKGGFEYIAPPSIERLNSNPDYHSDVYHETMEVIQTAYDKLIRLGIKPEDARYVLPNAAATNMTLTVNLRAFMDFYSKRNSNTHAQWEIAELAEAMRYTIELKEPWTRSLFELSEPAKQVKESAFNFKDLFKKKSVRIISKEKTTEEMVWKTTNHLYTMEPDGSFNSYSWEGFRRTLTPIEMQEVIKKYYKENNKEVR